MCGIVGYFGKKQTSTFLINLLKRLEYRGYDSAGIAYLQNNKISTIKSVGNIKIILLNKSKNYWLWCLFQEVFKKLPVLNLPHL